MARRDFEGDGEDAGALTGAYDEALVEYKNDLGKLSAKNLVEAFGGDRGALARSLAGLPAQGKVSGFSSRDQGRYRDQYKNIDRWLRYEAGDRSKQARNIERSRTTQEKIKDIFVKREPPRGTVTATITGWIGYNGDWRYRTITIPAIGKSVDTGAFNAAMAQGDTRGAYQALFDAYASGVTVAQADSFSLNYEE